MKHSSIPQKTARHASWRGILLRKLIAVTVKLTGGNILELAERHKRGPHVFRSPPRGWQQDLVILPSGARAAYLVPSQCTRRDTVILQLHGGAYIVGYMSIFYRQALMLSRLAGRVPVLALDYRTAPESPFPAALDDALAAVEWLHQSQGIPPEQVIAIGESAGAGLSLALAMRLRDSGLGQLKALVMMSPWTDLTGQGASYVNRYPLDPLFGSKKPLPDPLRHPLPGDRYAAGHDLRDPYISPLFGDFSDLPPMLIHVGECEMLYDDAVGAHEKAVAAGVRSELEIWPGMFHAFQLAWKLIPEARAAWREIAMFLRK